MQSNCFKVILRIGVACRKPNSRRRQTNAMAIAVSSTWDGERERDEKREWPGHFAKWRSIFWGWGKPTSICECPRE